MSCIISVLSYVTYPGTKADGTAVGSSLGYICFKHYVDQCFSSQFPSPCQGDSVISLPTFKTSSHVFPASFLSYPGAITSNWEVTGLRERGDGKSFHLPFSSIAAVQLHYLLLSSVSHNVLFRGKRKWMLWDLNYSTKIPLMQVILLIKIEFYFPN